jgi:microcystin-dependent protein
MSAPFVGEIKMFAGNFPPKGFALCNGQLLPISQYAAVFSILGTSFGGNGTSTFGLPNLQGSIPIGVGTGPGLSTRVIGEQGGVNSVTLLANEIPSHNHTLACGAGSKGETTSPTNSVVGDDAAATTQAYADTANTTMSPLMLTPAAASQPHENRQPFLAVTFIVALQGVFPARN